MLVENIIVMMVRTGLVETLLYNVVVGSEEGV